MLSKQLSDLIDSFVRSFDAEFPAVIEFRKARTQVRFPQGQMGWGSADIVAIGERVAAFAERRARFIWDRMQHVITSTDLEAYPSLNEHLKSQLAHYVNPTKQAAENFMEEIRCEAHASSGYTIPTKNALNNILPKINAEIDLVCASHSVSRNNRNQSGGTNINHVTGIVGNVTNSQVTVNDFGFICQILRKRNIPREARNELEDIWDALETSPADKKQSLVHQGQKWIDQHKDALGAAAEILSKAIGS